MLLWALASKICRHWIATYLYENNLSLEERFELEKQFFDDPILDYNRYNEYIDLILKKSKNNNSIYKITEEEPLGYTNFNYPLRHFKAGKGDKHIIVNSLTHGCELITVSFTLELMNKIANRNPNYKNLLTNTTIHFIPLLNPEGFIIFQLSVYIFC